LKRKGGMIVLRIERVDKGKWGKITTIRGKNEEMRDWGFGSEKKGWKMFGVADETKKVR